MLRDVTVCEHALSKTITIIVTYKGVLCREP